MSTLDSLSSDRDCQYYYTAAEVALPIVEGIEFRRSLGHEGWAIGSDGRVMSCKRMIGNHKNNPRFQNVWREVKPQINKDTGYYCVATRDKGNGKRGTIYIHKLVLEAFVGPAPENQECRHLDDNKSNNNISNLCWGTYKENAGDAKKFGKTPRGERQGRSKLTHEQVIEAREFRRQGWKYVRIWEMMVGKYGITITQKGFHLAISGAAWKHLDGVTRENK